MLACLLAFITIVALSCLAHNARGRPIAPVRAMRARNARARDARRVLRDATIAELEREVFDDYIAHDWSQALAPAGYYRTVIKGGRMYHVYADRAVLISTGVDGV